MIIIASYRQTELKSPLDHDDMNMKQKYDTQMDDSWHNSDCFGSGGESGHNHQPMAYKTVPPKAVTAPTYNNFSDSMSML